MLAKRYYQPNDYVLKGRFRVEAMVTNGLICTAVDDVDDFPRLVLVPYTTANLEDAKALDKTQARVVE